MISSPFSKDHFERQEGEDLLGSHYRQAGNDHLDFYIVDGLGSGWDLCLWWALRKYMKIYESQPFPMG